MTNTSIKTNISFSDISFVVQGGVDPVLTPQCLLSIRKYFPGAVIVLSSWAGSDVSGLDYDTLVLSDDPGGFANHKGKRPNNVNRQIVSTYEGLRQVRTPYSFKLRTDFILSSSEVVNYWDLFTAAAPGNRLFEKRPLACCYFTRDMRSSLKKGRCYPYHLSDIAFFGLTEDLKRLFDIPLMLPHEASCDTLNGHSVYVPEQYIFTSFLKKHGREVFCRFYNDVSDRARQDTEQYFGTDFVLLNFDQFGIFCPKEHFSKTLNLVTFYTCYTHAEWLSLYKKYTAGDIALPAVDKERMELHKLLRKIQYTARVARILSLPFWNKKRRQAIRARISAFLLSR